MIRRILVLLVVVGADLASARDGLKPRAGAGDYASRASAGAVEIGAAVLSPDQVQKAFATELNRGYVVVEVGVYPGRNARIDLGPGDFRLKVAGAGESVRPAGPKAIAAVLQKKASSDREITLHPTVGVGYGTGPSYDGRGRTGGWSTGAGVGVGVGGSQAPASTDDDRKAMETELAEQQLPERVVTAPVAGYLYFPLRAPKGRQPVTYELEYDSPAGRTVLRLPGK